MLRYESRQLLQRRSKHAGKENPGVRKLFGGISRQRVTSVEPGNIPSLALRRAPLASWISLILVPPFPMTDPIREFGIMNLMVTALLPGTDGLSNGSSLILRKMSPNAYRKLCEQDFGSLKKCLANLPAQEAVANIEHLNLI